MPSLVNSDTRGIVFFNNAFIGRECTYGLFYEGRAEERWPPREDGMCYAEDASIRVKENHER